MTDDNDAAVLLLSCRSIAIPLCRPSMVPRRMGRHMKMWCSSTMCTSAPATYSRFSQSGSYRARTPRVPWTGAPPDRSLVSCTLAG
jgi:hypothetical protein